MKRSGLILQIVLMLAMLCPVKGFAENFISIKELKNQTSVKWNKQYTDDYGRKVSIDLSPIIGEFESVPILAVEHPLFTEDDIGKVIDENKATKTETEVLKNWEYENEKTGEQIGITIYSVTMEAMELRLDHLTRERISSPDAETNEEAYYCSNEVDYQKQYLGENLISIQDCLDLAIPKIQACYPKYGLDFDLVWLDVVKNSRPHYRCILRQQFEGIPVLMGAGDPVQGIRQELQFEKPESWSFAQTFRWGSFFRPCWELDAYYDGGFTFIAAPLKEKDKIIDDVPLCNIDTVINNIEERIIAGYIRNIFALRFGYCCYIGENDEIILYPVWEVECTYFYNPKEGEEYTKKYDNVPYANELNYHTMIVSAQTGEFMDPIELKDKLLDCPKIITWEDVL